MSDRANTLKKPTQCEQVREALEAGRELTRLQATMEWGVLNLWQRVRELKAEGMDIAMEKRMVNGKKVGHYYLVKAETGEEGLPA